MSNFIKGGVGSGIKGHKTYHPKLEAFLTPLIQKLADYMKEYQAEGNTKRAQEVKEVLQYIHAKDIDSAIMSFQESSLKYDIGNTYTALVDGYKYYKASIKFGGNWGESAGTYDLWRAGKLDSKRGIFFSMNKEGAEEYSSLHDNQPAKKYTATIKNPLVSKNVVEAYSQLTGIPLQKIFEQKNRAKDSISWLRKIDTKVFNLAKKKGYDAITYTKPAPPAIKEMVILDRSSILEDIAKGGPGSGIRGHTTAKEQVAKRQPKSQDEAKKEIKNILMNDGFVNIGKDKWYEGDMKIFDTLFTDTMGLDKSKSRDENAVFTPSDTTKANMKEMYLVNQDYLQKKYGNTMTLYRGVNGNTYDEFKNLKEGEKASVDTYNISSWSSDPNIAERFAKGSKKGVVIKVEVPTKYILIHHDTFDVPEDYKDEKEVVLGGNQFTGKIMSFHERGGPK